MDCHQWDLDYAIEHARFFHWKPNSAVMACLKNRMAAQKTFVNRQTTVIQNRASRCCVTVVLHAWECNADSVGVMCFSNVCGAKINCETFNRFYCAHTGCLWWVGMRRKAPFTTCLSSNKVKMHSLPLSESNVWEWVIICSQLAGTTNSRDTRTCTKFQEQRQTRGKIVLSIFLVSNTFSVQALNY